MSTPVQPPDDLDDAIVGAYTLGQGPTAIAARLGVTLPAVRSALRRRRIKRRSRSQARLARKAPIKHQFTDEQIAEMAGMFAGGTTLADIGERFGASGPTIRKHLNRSGVETARRALSVERREEVIHRYRSGDSMRELSRVYGVSKSTILKALQDAGVVLRTLSESMKGRTPHNKRQFSDDEVAAIRRMWVDERRTAAEIADVIPDASEATIWRLTHELGFRKEDESSLRMRRAEEAETHFRAFILGGGMAELRRLYMSGLNFSEVARELGLPLRSVRGAMKDAKLENVGARLPLEVRTSLLAQYGKRVGARGPSLAEDHGISSVSVVNFVRSRGIDTAAKFVFDESEVARMKLLYEQGMGTREISLLLSRERNEDIRQHYVSSQLTAAGVNVSGFTLRWDYTTMKGERLKVHGTWELDVARYLDLLVARREVKSWSYETLRVDYVHDGKPRTYTPDFLVIRPDGSEEIWEVKGKRFSGTDAKLDAARDEGYGVEVFDADRIKEVWKEIMPDWDEEWLNEV